MRRIEERIMMWRYLIALTLVVVAGVALSFGVPVTAGQQIAEPSSQKAVPLSGQSTTRLADGRLLRLGGEGPEGATWTGSLYDPVTQAVIPLPGRMFEARAWHTATILPDGGVLIVGGRGPTGELLSTAERFDPGTETFGQVDMPDVLPRAGHTATLLTDGRILLIGGQTSRNALAGVAEVWNVASHSGTHVADVFPRLGHVATLLGDGRVLLVGGIDAAGQPAAPEIFDPSTNRVTLATPRDPLGNDNGLLTVTEATPPDGAANVPVNTRIALRLSHAARVETITDQTAVLSGPNGVVTTRVVAAEDGRLVFVWPAAPLVAGGAYTLSVSGMADRASTVIVPVALRFTTAQPSEKNNVADPEEWVPDPVSVGNGWRTNRPPSPWESLAPLMGPVGATAVSGRVLTLDGRPLPGVALTMKGDARTETDRTGRFLLVLERGTSDRRILQIQGRTASRPGRQYGFYEYGLTVHSGQTTILPFTIWMPKLDTRHAVTIPSPNEREVVITTPVIPGLELHLPAQTRLWGEDGKPVTEVSLTPVPLDRPPFPLAQNVDVEVYFTAQPGGTYVQTAGNGPPGAWLVYPNHEAVAPGQLAQFWHYDPDVKDWYVYGIGRISPDGRQGVPDPTTRFYELTAAMFSTGSSPPPKAPPPANCKQKGDPVDLSTGLLIVENTDLYLPDVMPVSLTRTYRPADSAVRAFGIGANHSYGIFLWSAQQYQQVDLILPDGGRLHYLRTSSGTGYADAVFEHTTTPSAFYKSTIRWNGQGWDLALKDGTVYVFGNNAPLQAIRDRYGNTTTVTHSSGQSGTITRVTSPNGRWLAFTYDGSKRIVQVQDNGGRTVSYAYDVNGRLSKVTDPNGGTTSYTYDSSHRMLTATNARGITFVTNQYDANGRVTRQTHADGGVYQFAYTLDGNGNVMGADVTDPRGTVDRTGFNTAGYCTAETVALGLPEAQATTWTRDMMSNLIVAMKDGLNRQTAYTYDASGNRLTSTRLAGTAEALTTTMTYEPVFNQVTSITDPLGHTTTLTYDAAGNVTSMADGLQQASTFTYGPDGQATSVTDPLGHVTAYGYAGGDLIEITDSLGRSSTKFLDAVGRLVSRTDPSGALYRYAYDSLERVVQMTDPLGGQIIPSYDANGNLTAVTDARANTTTYTYTSMDDRSSRTEPLMRTEHYEYDLDRNIVRFEDRKGQVSEFRYDGLNRRIFAGFGASGGSYESTIDYTYDAANRLTQAVDSASGTIALAYDDLDRLITATTPQGIVAYTYDDDGRRTTMTVLGQPTVVYTYDAAERLTSIANGDRAVTLSYDEANRRTSTVLPNGIVGNYGFDAANQLTGITYTLGSDVVGDLTYAYDRAGNRMGIGGRWARVSLPKSLAAADYDAANELTRWDAQFFEYDANGNLTDDGIDTYRWDARNQLASIAGRTSASFQYDAFGRRSSKAVGDSAVSFVYDGQSPVQELAGSAPVANLLSGLFVDQFFGRTDATGTSTYLIDAVNSTIALAGSDGTISTSFSYEPFGAVSVSGQAPTSAYQFTGRENDLTGLYYYRARYYSPTTGRFVSEDPLTDSERFGRALSLKDDLNSYTYARNDPVQWIDPDGLSTTSARIVIPRTPFPNGNIWPGFFRQDNECSLGGSAANDRRCVKNCCEGHDNCYTDHQCNMSSWGTGFVGPCGSCNLRLVKCLYSAVLLPSDADPCKCPKF
jgi:RHS repeat-associated protein